MPLDKAACAKGQHAGEARVIMPHTVKHTLHTLHTHSPYTQNAFIHTLRTIHAHTLIHNTLTHTLYNTPHPHTLYLHTQTQTQTQTQYIDIHNLQHYTTDILYTHTDSLHTYITLSLHTLTHTSHSAGRIAGEYNDFIFR